MKIALLLSLIFLAACHPAARDGKKPACKQTGNAAVDEWCNENR